MSSDFPHRAARLPLDKPAGGGTVEKSLSASHTKIRTLPLTINADEHPLMQRFHVSGTEKRSVVVLDNGDWNAWLEAADENAMRSILRPFRAQVMRSLADPRPVSSRRLTDKPSW